MRLECTAEQAQQWERRFSDGYRAARGDIGGNAGPRIELAPGVPADVPGENGAEYVARHVGRAWEIGYVSAWEYELAKSSTNAV
jgi:hypothetical protein